MRSSLVLTVIGADRTGLVESIAHAVAAGGGNWVESRMARLAGQFAGILRVDVPQDRRDALASALRELEKSGLHITLEPDDADEPTPPDDVRPLHFELMGQDRPGIIRDITHVLTQRGVNVADLHTQVTSAPMTSETLFIATADLHVPATESLEEVRAALEAIAHDLMVDITFPDKTAAAASS